MSQYLKKALGILVIIAVLSAICFIVWVNIGGWNGVYVGFTAVIVVSFLYIGIDFYESLRGSIKCRLDWKTSKYLYVLVSLVAIHYAGFNLFTWLAQKYPVNF